MCKELILKVFYFHFGFPIQDEKFCPCLLSGLKPPTIIEKKYYGKYLKTTPKKSKTNEKTITNPNKPSNQKTTQNPKPVRDHKLLMEIHAVVCFTLIRRVFQCMAVVHQVRQR